MMRCKAGWFFAEAVSQHLNKKAVGFPIKNSLRELKPEIILDYIYLRHASNHSLVDLDISLIISLPYLLG